MQIEIRSALFGYGARPVVRVENLSARPGEALGIFGANGSGKTTLMRGMCGLLEPISGSAYVSAELRIGYLPQQRSLQLHWPMSGLDAAGIALSARRPFGWIGRDRRRLLEAMTLLGVDDLAGKSFARCSGGQQQRLLLAGALATQPHLLMLDEPTDGLDVHSRQILLDTLKRCVREGVGVVLVTHEVRDVAQVCESVAYLAPGEVAGEPNHTELISPQQLHDRIFAAEAQR
jgi:ABC-type Mn2+/Zn2+ transport system ATPase subunit